MTDSLCIPPTMCRIITGLATPSHRASTGSPPSARAIRGTAQAMAAKPATEISLYTTTPAVTLSPTSRVTPSPIQRWRGP